jgi:hypothetical protein
MRDDLPGLLVRMNPEAVVVHDNTGHFFAASDGHVKTLA